MNVIGRFFVALFEEYKFARRASLAWACWLITVVVLRVTEAPIITEMSTSGATIVTAVIGILATVIGFYQWSRKKDDEENDGN